MANNDLQETLDRLLGELKSNDPARCLSAIQELGALNASSEAILLQLERLTLEGDSEVQVAALHALSLRTNQFVASKLSKLDKTKRELILSEIEKWLNAGLIGQHRAELLRRRYDFDIKPAQRAPVQPTLTENQAKQPVAPLETTIESVAPASPEPVGPRPSLIQTLLSESSIKVYLYLGAFFVIASALILAAVVEAARLPILALATAAFGGGAFVIRKRLPQPSFALFIVFSFLLPIDANVFEETVGLHEPALSIYWTFVFLAMAAIWSFSIWFHESSFFSVVAFVALSLAFYRAAQIFQTVEELSLLFGMIASLVALPAVSLLKKWKGNRFSLPVFLLAQLQALGLLAISLTFATVHVFDTDLPNGWWPVIALTWIIAASFFAASDILFPFILFPWVAVAALLPLPWFFLQTFEATEPAYAIGFWIWGTILALVSEVSFRLNLEQIKKYHWPLVAGSAPLFFTAIIIAFVWDKAALTFSLLAGIAVVYTALHISRPRWYVWSAALLSALAAYFVFFTLPFVERLAVPVIYQWLGASLLLTVPELFRPTALTTQNQTRLPTILLGLSVAVFTVALAFAVDTNQAGRVAIVFLLFAILLTLHAFHFKQPWIAYFACASEALAVAYGLQHFDLDLWLPALTILAVLYYLTGFLLRRAQTEFKEWGVILINSGLGLGLLLSIPSLILSKENAGWYLIGIALLFAVEIFARPLVWLEIIVSVLLSLSLFMILDDFTVRNALSHFLFGATLIWLGGDLVFGRLIENRSHRPIILGIGYLLLAASTVNLLAFDNTRTTNVYLVAYVVFFAVYAWMRREPELGYFVTAYIPLATIRLWDLLSLEKWIFPLIIFALIYYVIGSLLRRADRAKGWDRMLINSGLGLGVLTSIAAPFQGGLEASIPVAIAATLFAVEAFLLRSVWWALPADLLYLMSYFMILTELNVEQPQYYSIGAALLGMVMHYLLMRAGSKTGTFIAGMLSQLVLLGTTYIQMISANELGFFFVLFVQSMAILVYGLILRSRSMVITPIVFAVLGVVTVVYSALKGLSTVILVGCTGVILLMLGIVAVILRERITKFGEQLSDWRP